MEILKCICGHPELDYKDERYSSKRELYNRFELDKIYEAVFITTMKADLKKIFEWTAGQYDTICLLSNKLPVCLINNENFRLSGDSIYKIRFEQYMVKRSSGYFDFISNYDFDKIFKIESRIDY